MYIWIHMPLGDVLIAHSVCIYVYILIYNTLIYIKHLTHTYTQHIYIRKHTHLCIWLKAAALKLQTNGVLI